MLSRKLKGYELEHMPGLRFDPQSERVRKATDPCFSVTLMFLSVSLPSPLPKTNGHVLG